MRKLLFSLSLIGALMGTAHATPISITTFGTTYTQNFDGLANNPTFTRTGTTPGPIVATSSGTDAASLQGFEFIESGTTSLRINGQYQTDTGASAIGDSFSYGTATAPTDRAFGVLNSGTFANGTIANDANPGTAFGLVFTNDTGKVIDSLTLSYRGEQYRFGGETTGNPDRIDFQIDRDGNSIIGTNFTNINALDFGTVVKTGAARALDGNADGNFTNLTGTYAPVGGIGIGKSFVVRFSPIDQSGNDDGLAVDDFSMTANSTAPVPEPSTFALFAVGMLGFGLMVQRRRAADNGEAGIAALLG